MGKSDQLLINFYGQFIEKKHFKNVAFFGQSKENFISNLIHADSKHYYDLSLGNWDINKFPYRINHDQKFDLIVCTRCAYFGKYPVKIINNFKKLLNNEGKILIDWGLGDHWRFSKFKVGWVKDNEHEWAYNQDNHLWSAYLSKKMLNSEAFKQFAYYCRQKNYIDVKNAIKEEVPVIIYEDDFPKQEIEIVKEKSIFLWPDSPQIYTCLLLSKKRR